MKYSQILYLMLRAQSIECFVVNPAKKIGHDLCSFHPIFCEAFIVNVQVSEPKSS